MFREGGPSKSELIDSNPVEVLPYDDTDDTEVVLEPRVIELRTPNGTRQVEISAVTMAGKPGRANEDAFAAVSDEASLTVGVFDGVSSRIDYPNDLGDTKGARFASHFVRGEFLSKLAESDKTDMRSLISEINSKLAEKTAGFEGVDSERASTLPSTTATVVKIDTMADSLEIAHVADSYCLLFQKNGESSVATLDTNYYHMYRNFWSKDKLTPEEREARTTKSFDDKNNPVNGTFGTGVMNGSPMMDRYIDAQKIDLTDIEAVLIASDGFLTPDLSQNSSEDRAKLRKIITEEGVAGVVRRNREYFANPPAPSNGVRKPSIDDATGIFIRLLPSAEELASQAGSAELIDDAQ